MEISQRGIDFIKQCEGVRLKSYLDVADVWTIGVGHTGPEVVKGLVWTQAQVDSALRHDLHIVEACINDVVKVNINQNQIDALCSFAFNLGTGALRRSTLLEKLNDGDVQGAANEFLKWIRAGGKEQLGLKKRRAKERELFLN